MSQEKKKGGFGSAVIVILILLVVVGGPLGAVYYFRVQDSEKQTAALVTEEVSATPAPEEVLAEQPASTPVPEAPAVVPASAPAQAVEAASPAIPVPAPAPAETREELEGKPGGLPACSKGEAVQCLAYNGWKIEVVGLSAGDIELISFARQLHDLKVGSDGNLKETTGTITFDTKEVLWSIEPL